MKYSMETIKEYLEYLQGGNCEVEINSSVANEFVVSYSTYGDMGLRSVSVLTVSLLELLDFVNGKF